MTRREKISLDFSARVLDNNFMAMFRTKNKEGFSYEKTGL